MPNWREHAAGVEEFDGAVGQMGSDMEVLPTHVTGVSEKLTNLGNTLMQVSMAFTSLQQLKDIWT